MKKIESKNYKKASGGRFVNDDGSTTPSEAIGTYEGLSSGYRQYLESKNIGPNAKNKPSISLDEGNLQRYLDDFKAAVIENNTQKCYSLLDMLKQQLDQAVKMPGWKNTSTPESPKKTFFENGGTLDSEVEDRY
jgi:hypothetical protein